jgi:hypothetical protein
LQAAPGNQCQDPLRKGNSAATSSAFLIDRQGDLIRPIGDCLMKITEVAQIFGLLYSKGMFML